MLVAAALLVYANQVEPYWIEVTHHRVAAPLDPPLKIAHLTDLHSTGIGRREKTLLALLEEERPDLILITGDCVGVKDLYRESREVLKKLRAPLGVWLARGNWEIWSLIPREHEFFASARVKLLRNEAAEVRPGVWLAGFDDAASGTPDLERGFAGIPAGAYRIALFHSPAFFDHVAGRADLALAGHTHGGQVRIPGLPPLWLPRGAWPYVEGWYEKNGSRMYVSRGVGTSVLPVRFSCRPEVAIITVGASFRSP